MALEAIKGQQTLAELSTKHDVRPVMISKWKSEFLERMSMVFEGASSKEEETSMDSKELYAQIGQLKVENDYLKKSCKKLGIEV